MTTSLKQHLSHFASDRRGNVAIIFAAALTPIIVALGSSVDYGRALSVRTHLQQALDAAVVGAAKATNVSIEERLVLANQIFTANFLNGFAASATPQISNDGNRIIASANASIDTTFLGVVGLEGVEVSVNSTANAVQPKPICLLALNETKSKAIEISGTGTLTAVNCSVQTNSTAPDALYAGGTTSASSTMFCTVGGWSGTNFTPRPKTCGHVADPYAGMAYPESEGCDYNNESVRMQQGPRTLSPGIYCGGLDIRTHAEATLQPGVYIMKDGPFSVGSGAEVTGLGVTIYLVGDDALVDIDGGAIADLRAQTEGNYEGFLFIQDPNDIESSDDETSVINGGGDITMVGTIYLPGQTVFITGGGSFGINSPLMPIIADSFMIRGNGVFQIDMDQANMDVTLPMTNDGSIVLN
ncbi:MAG: hypothetical protein GC150_01935 [Rhizobiales bacterium]|nr:hypothetical protein [Hyphomicrobiales bacterium]